jgi:hypothetical protein
MLAKPARPGDVDHSAFADELKRFFDSSMPGRQAGFFANWSAFVVAQTVVCRDSSRHLLQWPDTIQRPVGT